MAEHSCEARLIINPKSGTRSKSAVPDMLSKALAEAGMRLSVKPTAGSGDAAAIAREAVADGCRMVVVAGGDGTVNEAASALVATDVPLGIIPCGSGNGLARSLAISQDIEEAIRTVTNGYTINIDCGMVGEKPFFCTFGMGFDAAVTEKFEQEHRRGRMIYVKNALIEFLRFKPQVYAISIDGRVMTEKALVVAVCNANQYGNNAYIAPSASLTDGLLDVTIIQDGPPLLQALAGIQMLSGRIDKNFLVHTFRVSRVEISRLDDGPAHIDGELFSPGRHMEIGCRPSALRVIADPAVNKPFHPITTPLQAFLKDLKVDLVSMFRP